MSYVGVCGANERTTTFVMRDEAVTSSGAGEQVPGHAARHRAVCGRRVRF